MGKLIITEEERKNILKLYEQDLLSKAFKYSPAGVAWNLVSNADEYSPAGLLSKGLSYTPAGKSLEMILTNLTIDDWINLTSAAFDVVPGIGWVVSAGIDVVHAVSYGARFYKSTTDEDKLKNAVSGIFTLVMTVFPIGGNITNIIMSRGINKSITKFTPAVIKTMLGLPKGFNLTKPVWKYSLFIFLLKFATSSIDQILTTSLNQLNNIINHITGPVKQALIELANLIQELKTISNDVINPNYGEIKANITL